MERAAGQSFAHLLQHRVVLVDVSECDGAHHDAIVPKNVTNLVHFAYTFLLYSAFDCLAAYPRCTGERAFPEVGPGTLPPNFNAMIAFAECVIARLSVAKEKEHKCVPHMRIGVQKVQGFVESWQIVAVVSRPLLSEPLELTLKCAIHLTPADHR
mmetsp:Transcript_18260/g.55064  ORF Transcript_18260/g.55064 Transcript_18260/m.55064 type:complete len:155 (+) Transcript_18260:2937-3401(+)|eukprot:scaffold34630_cov31-Tisochrysis_lutea.AAC.2